MFCLIILPSLLLASVSVAAPAFQYDVIVTQLITNFTKQVEQQIPGWDEKVALVGNIKNCLASRFNESLPVTWQPKVALIDNIATATDSVLNGIKIPGFNSSDHVRQNIVSMVSIAFNETDLPVWFPKDELIKRVCTDIETALVKVNFAGFNLLKPVSFNFVTLMRTTIQSFPCLDGKLSILNILYALVDNVLAKIVVPGFTPGKTLRDNVLAILLNA